MRIYYFEGYARQAGAIGARHKFNAEVHAETEDQARLALYENWEHIHIEHVSERLWKDAGITSKL